MKDQQDLLNHPHWDALYLELGDDAMGYLLAESEFTLRANHREALSEALRRDRRVA